MSDQYAVVGHPVSHSLSPRIHQLFALQTQQDLEYRAIDAPTDAFVPTVDTFRAAGGRGLNITVPFKQEAFAYAQTRSVRAERAGAVNTLIFSEHQVHGDTTDGVGLLRDITDNLHFNPAHKRLLIIGAGGAVRGILEPLIATQPTKLVIANRTLAKAEAIAADFADAMAIEVVELNNLSNQAFDVIINATSAGLNNDLPSLPLGLVDPQCFCYDLLYRLNQPTPFVRWCRQQGAEKVYDGLGMLVEQAAEAFFLWRGVRPATSPVIRALKA